MRHIRGAVAAGVEWLCDGKREDENEDSKGGEFCVALFWLRLLPLMTGRVARGDYGTGLVGCLNVRQLCCCFGDCRWVRSVTLSDGCSVGGFFALGVDLSLVSGFMFVFSLLHTLSMGTMCSHIDAYLAL